MDEIIKITDLNMDSRKIAEITGKRHADVLRDIDETLRSLNADLRLGYKSTTYKDSTGKSNRCYELDKDSAMCLVSGYDVTSRMKIIKRWQELEAQQQFQLPQTFGEALQLAADQYKVIEKQTKQIEKDKPMVEFANHITTVNPKLTIDSYAKLLTKEHQVSVGYFKLYKYFRELGYLLSKGKFKNKPAQKYIQSGLFEYRFVNNDSYQTTFVTLKGQKELTNDIVKHFRLLNVIEG